MPDPVDGGIVVLTLPVELDVSRAPVLKAECESLFQRGRRRFLLDLAQVRFLDSSALGYLITFGNRLQAHGGQLALSRPSDFFRQTVALMGLEDVFRVYADEATARAALEALA